MCIKKEGNLARNSIKREGHVAHKSHNEGGRHSTRLRRENTRLEDYTL